MGKYISEHNKSILKRYKMHCKNKGLTKKSIEAMLDTDLRLFLEYIGDIDIEDITHEICSDFLIYCSEERNNKAKALARKFTSINTFFDTLVKQDVISKNPMNKLEKPKIRKTIRPHLDLDEYHTLSKYIDSVNDLRGAALISLLYSSGCRLSEVHQLNKDSLDFAKRQFIVCGKGEKERVCMFNAECAMRVKAYLNSRTDTNPALFISKLNKRWSTKAIQDFLTTAGKRAGIKKRVHPHLFRHTRAMALLRAGVPLETIQRVLGHESIATTQIYAHNTLDDVQEQVDKIDTAMFEKDVI
ncbi:tyrosine-type recombinase/integrase [Defluviitalea saccharophila]|uniref:Tyrosine-type recombinase/integrase n=1 Tax=Defluviitalea saccharophila TaxID=879970 RepID=A0ABZ2Y5J6_9FIRM